MTHFFYIADEQFSCTLEEDYSDNGHTYWMPNDYSGFGIDHTRAFRTKESCEKYMKDEVRKTCNRLLKDMK